MGGNTIALRAPSQPMRLLPAYASGDHLRPNIECRRAVANAIASASGARVRHLPMTAPRVWDAIRQV